MKKHQAALSLVFSRDADPLQRLRCKSFNLTASIPLGSAVRPLAISPTVEEGTPTLSAISEMVMSDDCKSRILEDHSVFDLLMAPNIREPVPACQRQPAPLFGLNQKMISKRTDTFSTIGERAKHWREVRGLSKKETAKRAGIKETTYVELENVPRNKTKNLHQLAAVLGISAIYLETGRGEPEAASNVLSLQPWPLEVDPGLLTELSPIERKYAAMKLTEVLQEIAASKPKRNKA